MLLNFDMTYSVSVNTLYIVHGHVEYVERENYDVKVTDTTYRPTGVAFGLSLLLTINESRVQSDHTFGILSFCKEGV